MIGSTVNSATYAGNGSTSTAYVIPFRYDASSWVKVTVTNALGEIEDLEQVTDYTLAGTGSTANGTFTTIAAISSTSTVSVYREAPGTQTLSLPANTALPAVAVEAQLDRLAMAAQDSVTKRELAAQLSALLIEAGVNITTDDLLALLENANIPANGLILANTAGVALAAPSNPEDASVAWNETLQTLVRHDGATIGGVPVLYNDPFVATGSKFTSNFTVAKEVELAEFPLTALQALANKRFRLTGTIHINVTGPNRPANFYLGLTTRSNIDDNLGLGGAFPARLGLLEGYAYPTASKDTWIFYCNEEFILNDSSPNFTLATYQGIRTGIIFNGATLAGDSKTLADTVAVGTDVGLMGTNDEALVLVFQGEAGGGSGCTFLITYSLKLEQTV